MTQPHVCLQGSGDRATRATAHLVGSLVTALSHPEDSAAAVPPQAHAPRTAAAALKPSEAAAAGLTDASHTNALQRLRSYTQPPAAPRAPEAAAGTTAGSVGAKRPRPAAAAVPGPGPQPQLQRFVAVEAWCSCPVGTLPSGVPRVGITPQFRRRVTAAAATAAVASGDALEVTDGGRVEAASDGPGRCVIDGAAGAAAAGSGGGTADAGGASDDDSMHAVEVAAERDILSALNEAPVAVEEECGGVEGVEGGEGGGEASAGAADARVGSGPGGVGLLGLHSLWQGHAESPVQDAELRERIKRACAAVLR